jgi:hypothetical protein
LDKSEVYLERGIGFTTPLRTMCDVLRVPHFTERNKHELETLIRMTNTTVDDIFVALSEKRKVPYKDMAISRLNLLTL